MVSFSVISTQVLEKNHREMISLMSRVAYSIKEYLPWCSEEEVRQSTFSDSFQSFKGLFERHAVLAEKEVFPLLKNEPQCQFAVLRARQAYHMGLTALTELQVLPFTHEIWGPKFHVLRDLVLTAIREEETTIMPWLTEHDSADIEAYCA